MTVTEFRTLLHAKPFIPFRVITSDDTIYSVSHPDLIMVAMTSVVIGYPDPRMPDVAERYDIVSMRHIVRLEPEKYPAASVPTEGKPPREDS